MKKIFTIVLIALFAINVFGQKVINNNLNIESRLTNMVVQKTGITDPVKEFALKQLLNFNTDLKSLSFIKKGHQKMDSLIYFGELDLGGIVKDSAYPASLLTYFNYLENGYTSEEYIALWDTLSNGWTDLLKVKMNYNDDNTVDEIDIGYNMGVWLDIAKAMFSYDGDGNVSEIDISMINEDTFQFVDILKVLFTREGDLVNVILVKMYDTDNDLWADVAQVDITYNDMNYVSELIVKAIQIDVKEMNNVAKVQMEYDNNRISEMYDYEWDSIAQTWNEMGKQVYSYEDNGNTEMIMTYEKYEGNWIDAAKQEFEYNNDYAYDQLILPYMFIMKNNNLTGEGNLFNHMLTKATSYSVSVTKPDDWVEDGEIACYYSAGEFSSVNEIEEGENPITVFPNPAEDVITIKIASNNAYQFNIFDVTGKTVISKTVKNGDEIPVERLKSGVYFYKIENNSFNYSGKLIKK